MAIKNIIAAGVGFSPGTHFWILTRGLGSPDSPPFPPLPVGARPDPPDVTILQYSALQTLIEALGTATLFDDCTVHLIKADIVMSPNDTIASYTEADYTGYAAQALGAFVAAFANPQGDIVAEFPHLVFSPTGTAVGNTIYGWWIQGPLGGVTDVLIDAHHLDTAMVLNSPLTALVAECRIPFGQPRGD